MTNFINKLTAEERGDLLYELGFQLYGEGERQGTNVYSRDGYKVYHTWNRNYMSSKDYDEETIKVSDFDVRYCWGDKDENNKTLYNFMFNKFGQEWADKAIKYFTGKKAVAKVRLIESLVENAKTETQNVEDNI